MVTNSMKLCTLALAIDGREDRLISCSKEGEKCKVGRALLESQMQLPNDELHKDPTKIYLKI